MNQQQQLRRVTSLAQTNRSLIDAIHEHLSFQLPSSHSHESHQFRQVRQQYEVLLSASRDSVNRNAKLQAQLDSRQEQLSEMRAKNEQRNNELHDLREEMDRATHHWRHEQKNKKVIGQIAKDNDSLQRQIGKVKEQKAQTRESIAAMRHKNQELTQSILKTEEDLNAQSTAHKQETNEAEQRYQGLTTTVSHLKAELESLKSTAAMQTPHQTSPVDSSPTPKQPSFRELYLKIRQQREGL